MFKIVLLPLLTCITFSCSAMQNQHLQLPQWVLEEHSIKVKSSSNRIYNNLAINDYSTVADIKTAIHEREGTPATQLTLHPLYSMGFLLANPITGPELKNHDAIKQIMNLYRTRDFFLIMHNDN